MLFFCLGLLLIAPIVDGNRWTPWIGSDQHGDLGLPCMCPGNLMISSQQFLHHAGEIFVNVRVRCGVDGGYPGPAVPVQCLGVNADLGGTWHEELRLRSTNKFDVKWQDGLGITGVSLYSGSAYLVDDHGGGSWLNMADNMKAGPYEAYGGVQVRHMGNGQGNGFLNMRYWCVPKEIKHTEVSFDLIHHVDRDPGGRFSEEVQFEYGMEAGSSTSAQLEESLHFSLDVGFEFMAFTSNMNFAADMKSVMTTAAQYVRKEKETRKTFIEWNLEKPMWLYQVRVTTTFVDDDIMEVKGANLILSEALAQSRSRLGRFIREPNGWVMWEKDGKGYTVGACSMCPPTNLCEKVVTVSTYYLNSLPRGPAFTCDQMPTGLAALHNTTAVI